MNKKLSLVLALMVTGLFPALTIYAWQNKPVEYTEKGAVDLSLYYLKNSPTFSFDGMADSVEVLGVDTLRMPWTWEVIISFQCRQAGYGDRTEMILAQVITPHTMRVVVSEGEVRSAVIDGVWDELNQGDVGSELLPPEMARDLAVRYILDRYPELGDLELPAEWVFTDLTPEGLLGYSTFGYTGLEWSVNVSFMVVLEPTYNVYVEHSGDVEFTWEGTVDQSSTVTETSTSLTPTQTEILSPEQARDLAVEYVLANYPELEGVEEPTVWAMEDLTPEGLLGYSTFQYASGSWAVEVGFPVVWKPTYQVELTLDVEPVFTWTGTVAQDGTVSTF
jgi:hypothetical protein